MPKLDMVVDSLDSVDEGFRALYSEGDNGQFVLNAGGVDKHPEVAGLKKNQQRALDQLTTVRGELREMEERFEGIDPDRAREAVAKFEEWEAKGSVPEEDAIPRELHEKRLQAAKEASADEVEKANERAERLQGALEKREILGALHKAVTDAGFMDEYRDDVVRRLLEDKPEVVWDEDEPRGVFKDPLGDSVSIPDYVAAFAKGDKADKYMPPTGNKGSGAKGGTGDRRSGGNNPFAADTRNVTEQMRLVREHPDRARMLAAEAGVKFPKLDSAA